jgi:Peptidase family M23
MGFDRRLIAIVILTLSLVVPAALCAAAALLPAPSRPALALCILAAAAWMALLWQVNWWGFTAPWLRWLWPVALALVAGLRFARFRPAAPPAAGLGVAALLLLGAAILLLVPVLRARSHPGPAVELAFPLAGGRFLVADGGDGARSFLLNYHYGFGKHRASGVSASMRYAMDVVEVGRVWGEARGFLPRRNAAFRIWERPLRAPCDGRVARVVGDVEDNAAFGSHRPYGLGNHVVLAMPAGAYVVLGHLRRGSVAVAEGETVRAGQLLGRVGNSGWTERPHLHMQAMRSAVGDWWHGEPLAMRFAGRFLVRNRVVRA